MNGISECCERQVYNSFSSMKDMVYNILVYLMNNEQDLWKLLKYNTPNALSMPNLTSVEKAAMIYNGTGDMTKYNVFRSPYIDDAMNLQCSQLKIYVTSINPRNVKIGTVDIAFEIVTHIKLTDIDNYQSRLEVMMQRIFQTLNGVYIGGIGKLAFDANLSFYDLVKLNLYSNRNYYGYTIIMSTSVSGDIQC